LVVESTVLALAALDWFMQNALQILYNPDHSSLPPFPVAAQVPAAVDRTASFAGAQQYASLMPLRSGDVFAGFVIERFLGSGATGEVYLARHPRLPWFDALKVLPAALTADAEFRRRFNREADLAATLWHPHIVGIHDHGKDLSPRAAKCGWPDSPPFTAARTQNSII
jgi:hypothetical protein